MTPLTMRVARSVGEFYTVPYPNFEQETPHVSIQSMTGYGEQTILTDNWEVCVRLKTLNHRHLDARINGLDRHPHLQLKVRDVLQRAFARGRVDLEVEMKRAKRVPTLRFDAELAQRYLEALNQIGHTLGLEQPPSLEFLMGMEGVTERDVVTEDTLWDSLQQGLERAVAEAQSMRVDEGKRLETQLVLFVEQLQHTAQQVAERMPSLKDDIRQRLIERIAALNDNIHIDQGRLEEEVILYAERSDISEELARLQSHFEAVEQALSADKPAGKTLDFLAQEMGREINTIGAKAKDIEISHGVVEMKTVLERFREQVRNIE